MRILLEALKKIVGQTDYPVKDSNLNDGLRQAVNLPSLPFGYKESTTVALTLGLYGGEALIDGVLTTKADTTTALTASTTNYVEHDRALAVTKNTVGFSADKYPIAEVVTDAGSITGYTDRRNANTLLMEGQLSVSVAGAAGTTVLTAAQWRNNIQKYTGALTGNRVLEAPTRVCGPKVIVNGSSGAFTMTVKTNAGAGVVVAQGKTAVIYCDGVDILAALTDPAGVGGFPSGTRMLFQQTAAPTGWTKETSATYNDAALRIVTGTAGTGGADAFTTHFGTGKSTAGFTITITEMPVHDHDEQTCSSSTGGAAVHLQADTNTGSSPTALGVVTGSRGGGGSHLHAMSNFNIKYADSIIASKD